MSHEKVAWKTQVSLGKGQGKKNIWLVEPQFWGGGRHIELEAPLSLVTEGGTGCLKSRSPDVDRGQMLSLGAVTCVTPALHEKGLGGCWVSWLPLRAPCLYFLPVL